MDSESLDRAWDPAAPGAGALRATAIAQLYFRITSHHPLTILIVDAMCLTFGADGVTVQELVDYLGITEDRIRFGLESIPAEMRCTTRQLELEGENADHTSTNSDTSTYGSTGNTTDQLNGRQVEKEARYFLNYKRLLPLVYAHVTRLLLSTCVVDVPPCSYVAAVKAAQLAPYSRSSDGTAHAFFAAVPSTAATSNSPSAPYVGADVEKVGIATTPTVVSASGSLATPAIFVNFDGTGEHFDVSDAMRRKSATRGVYCLGCSCYFLVEEFAETLSKCPRCGKDSLRLCVQSIQRQLNARIADQHTVVKLLPSVNQVWKRSMSAFLASREEQQPQQEHSMQSANAKAVAAAAGVNARNGVPPTNKSSVYTTSAQQNLNCALANDPFLFQQALAFFFLFASRFASVNDAVSVVDAQQILTEPEYRERLRGKASLADQFRSRHRHATSVHVHLVSQEDVDAARRAESDRKLLKRAMLPPWLRHTSALDALGGGHGYTTSSAESVTEGHPMRNSASTELGGEDTSGLITNEPWESEGVKTSRHTKGSTALQSGVVWRFDKKATVTAGEKRKRPAEIDLKRELTKAANFIAINYFEDDYDEVPLPLSRPWRP